MTRTLHDANQPVSPLADDVRDGPPDRPIAFVRKGTSARGYDVRLRTLRSGDRTLLVRLCSRDTSGVWHPDGRSTRCGLTVRPNVIGALLDALEEAEAAMIEEGHLRES